MAVDLIGYKKMNDHMAIQEAASAGLKSMENLIRIFQSHQGNHQEGQLDCKELTNLTVSKFKQLVSILTRTGHARFRRGLCNNSLPTTSSSLASQSESSKGAGSPPVQSVTLDHSYPVVMKTNRIQPESTPTQNPVLESSPFLSLITREGSVSNGKNVSPTVVVQPLVVSTGKPPIPSSHKKRCAEVSLSENISGQSSLSAGCHCSKRRKSGVKKVVRVPAISPRFAEIPADEYSWRKYGQKPIKGSPYPHGYYRCSSGKDCPARKRIERATDDPTMLVVTYEGEHNRACSHSWLPVLESSTVPAGSVGLAFQST